mgnify:CR=1 FL=1
MVQTAETDRDTAIQRSAMVAKQAAQQTNEDIRGQMDKLAGLERDHMKLTAQHSIAEVNFSSFHWSCWSVICHYLIEIFLCPNQTHDQKFWLSNFHHFQSKIRELEERLREEVHQRKLVQDKTAEVGLLFFNICMVLCIFCGLIISRITNIYIFVQLVYTRYTISLKKRVWGSYCKLSIWAKKTLLVRCLS